MISYKGKEYVEYDNAIALLEKKEQEIKRLKEEYMMLQNASDEVEEEKDREIERLNNIINTIQQEMENLNDTGIFSIKPKYVWQRIETLKGSEKE